MEKKLKGGPGPLRKNLKSYQVHELAIFVRQSRTYYFHLDTAWYRQQQLRDSGLP